MALDIKTLVAQSHQTSREHGFWEGPENANVPTKLALIHSEISEALECYRDGDIEMRIAVPHHDEAKPEGLPIELADAMIRIADLAGYLGIDLEMALRLKLAYNLTRPHMHGGKRV